MISATELYYAFVESLQKVIAEESKECYNMPLEVEETTTI